VGIPEGIKPVKNFEVNRYLGKWYEIARLDHSFERGLEHVSAEYSVREDGGIKVINRGFNTLSNTWSEAEGKAYFVEANTEGYLKVSFFGPFYGAYIIFDLGLNYEYSLVTSSDRSYLWLLSRTPVINDALKNDLVSSMADLGFETTSLIFVEQFE
jgi:apolipoprotein D and lipocalin family protein